MSLSVILMMAATLNYYEKKNPRPSPVRATHSTGVILMMADTINYYEKKNPRPSPVRATHILVCFKVVPDLDAMNENDWQAGDNLRPETRFVKSIINPLDESALELALKLRDQGAESGREIKITAVTIGDEKADSILKTLLALRFDGAVRLGINDASIFRPEIISILLKDWVNNWEGFDLILMGGQSADGGNAAVPLLLAEQLGWPCITEVTGLCLAEDRFIKIESQSDDGRLKQIIKSPCVLAIGNAPSTYLRVPTLKDRMSYGKRPVQVLEATVPTVDASYELTSLKTENHNRDGCIFKGLSETEIAGRIFDDYLKPWLEKRRS